MSKRTANRRAPVNVVEAVRMRADLAQFVNDANELSLSLTKAYIAANRCRVGPTASQIARLQREAESSYLQMRGYLERFDREHPGLAGVPGKPGVYLAERSTSVFRERANVVNANAPQIVIRHEPS